MREGETGRIDVWRGDDFVGTLVVRLESGERALFRLSRLDAGDPDLEGVRQRLRRLLRSRRLAGDALGGSADFLPPGTFPVEVVAKAAAEEGLLLAYDAEELTPEGNPWDRGYEDGEIVL